MFLKNNTTTKQSKGDYTIFPGCWGVIPDKYAASWLSSGDFEQLPPTTGRNIIVYAGCPTVTTGGGQHPTQISRELTRLGHRVVYIQNSYTDDPELIVIGNTHLFSSKLVDEAGLKRQREIWQSLDNPVILFTFPSNYSSSLAAYAKQDGYQVAYWCLDDWEAINLSMGNVKYRPEFEVSMCQAADTLIATASNLASHIIKISDKPCAVIPNGWSDANFPQNIGEPLSKPEDLVQGSKTLVYWGELGGKWIDWNLIEDIAVRLPEYQINLIGPNERCGKPVDLPNVHYLGSKPVSELYQYGYHSDAGLIPFRNDSVSSAVNPIKAYEYLASNMFILGPSWMPELDKFPNCLRYRNTDEAVGTLNYIGNCVKVRQDDFLRQSTWRGRAQQFLETIECRSLSKAL